MATWLLDLARNALSDANVTLVMETLTRLDVRVDRLRLAGNRCEGPGLSAITEYVWNCQEALFELDLEDNEVTANPKAPGAVSGSDAVSALLRCLYNHACYPRPAVGSRVGAKVVPLLLRMSGNRICHPKRLLKEIQAKSGKKHMRVCPSLDPYTPDEEEYLSVCLPDFTKQRPVEDKSSRKTRRTSEVKAELVAAVPEKPGKRPVLLTAAAALVAPAGPETAQAANSQAVAGQKRQRSGSRARSRRRRRRSGSEPVAAAGADNGSGPSKEGAAVPAEASTGHPPEGAEEPRETQEPSCSDEESEAQDTSTPLGPAVLGEEAQRELQSGVCERLRSIEGLPSEDSTCEMLSEFVVCMVIARKSPADIELELSAFLGNQAKSLTEWVMKTVEARIAAAVQ
eukprot:CAMPEP_0170617290 /NCGR_PEP_ID=MMETSP0224-20130122/26336_1 /TAXON_ID=285029 /ORGANISM="Togula jolla, Strain CCCM 725" /LENGTH=398 /DNA_ID=CAMNT_0010943167 /DNA_START=109 /DNA_END=1306 /DNA_ORIENTATION=-